MKQLNILVFNYVKEILTASVSIIYTAYFVGILSVLIFKLNKFASAGNRTRASRVAGENSTTEPPMLMYGTEEFLFKKIKILVLSNGCVVLLKLY